MKRIAFFSVGFAFNRLIRLRFYEKIFPKDVEVFLITTNKYSGTKEMDYQSSWDLKRTKVVVFDYNLLKLPFKIRDFCKKHGIDRVSNLGHPFGAFPLIPATLCSNRKLLLYFLGDVLQIHKNATFSERKAQLFLTFFPYAFLSHLAFKSAFVGKGSFNKAPTIFLRDPSSFHYLLAPVNTSLFKPGNKGVARKKLGIGLNEKVVLLTGKVTFMKGGDILSRIIKANPDIKFIVIGKWIEKQIPSFKSKNLVRLSKVPNEKLPDYYVSADLSFAFHRQGDQMGIVGSESLACGTPLLHSRRIAFKDSPAILKISDSASEANRVVREFFSLSDSKRLKISRISRDYAMKWLSDEVWKEGYLNFFLG